MKLPKALLCAALFLPPSLSQALTLQWNVNPPAELIIGYEVAFIKPNEIDFSIYNAGNMTQITLFNTFNVTTTFWVRAYSITQTGPWSAPLQYDPNAVIPVIKTTSFAYVKNPSTGVITTTMNLSGTPNLTFSVQTSEDLLIWLTVFTGQINASGTYSFQHNPTKPKLFYRTQYTQ